LSANRPLTEDADLRPHGSRGRGPAILSTDADSRDVQASLDA
jgi:hypothetical protein